MMKSLKFIFLSTLFVTLSVSSIETFASGGYGGGGGGGYGGAPAHQRQIDERYEYGKAVYNGRLPGSTKYKYCVTSKGEKLPLKGSRLKPFKKTSYQELSDNLFSCEEPDKLMSTLVAKKDYFFTLYYLNKRYRLKIDK